MALFGHKDPLKNGIRARAYIERVVATARRKSVEAADGTFLVTASESAIVYRFTGVDGATVVHEQRLWGRGLCLPGSTVDIGYFPDKLDDLVADWSTLITPSASEARGWAAGIFAVEPLGTLRSDPADRELLDGSRELFRTGRRSRGTFTMGGLTGINDIRHGTFHWAGSIKVDDREYPVQLWVLPASVPEVGDMIEVAVSADGSQLAFDSDERFDGPPGQALVLIPAPAGTRPTEQETVQANVDRMSAMQASGLEQQWQGQLTALQNLANYREQMDEASFAVPKGQLLSRLLSSPASPNPPAAAVLASINALHVSGALDDAEVAALLAKFGTPS
jgi:hypothetical protein